MILKVIFKLNEGCCSYKLNSRKTDSPSGVLRANATSPNKNHPISKLDSTLVSIIGKLVEGSSCKIFE